MARKPDPPPVEPREFTRVEEIDRGIIKLQRRIEELEQLDVESAILQDTGADDIAESNIREAIREVFGQNSPEFREHEYMNIWAGPMFTGMSKAEIIEGTERGRNQVRGILQGLIGRLKEKRDDIAAGQQTSPRTYFERLNLHQRIADVANDLFLDGYHWEAVFAAAKALVNYVKERSGRHDLDECENRGRP